MALGLAATSIIVSAFFLTEQSLQISVIRIPLSIVFTGIGLLLGWYASQFLKHPALAQDYQNSLVPSGFHALQSAFPSSLPREQFTLIYEDLSVSNFISARDTIVQFLAQHPRDCVLLWLYADLLFELNDPAAAENTCDRLIAELPTRDSSLCLEPGIFYTVSGKRLHAIMFQNDRRFESACTAFLQNIISDQQKTTLLDQLACIPLVQQTPELYHSSEFCIRKALEIAPHSLTLKGTLGALLAESGQFAEAEPLLRACHQSPADNDRGITSYYLALLAEHSGDLNTARKLAKQSIAIYPEPWLVKKANTLLKRLTQP